MIAYIELQSIANRIRLTIEELEKESPKQNDVLEYLRMIYSDILERLEKIRESYT